MATATGADLINDSLNRSKSYYSSLHSKLQLSEPGMFTSHNRYTMMSDVIVVADCNDEMMAAQDREMARQGRKPHPNRGKKVIVVHQCNRGYYKQCDLTLNVRVHLLDVSAGPYEPNPRIVYIGAPHFVGGLWTRIVMGSHTELTVRHLFCTAVDVGSRERESTRPHEGRRKV